MKIRHMKMQDIISCAEILKLNYENSPFHEVFEDDNHIKYIENKYYFNTCFVVEEKQKIKGFCLCSLSYWTNGLQGILEEIQIHPNIQNQGIGKKLYQFAEQELKALGVKSILLWSRTDTPAFYFHKRNGFFQGDEVVMYKNIS